MRIYGIIHFQLSTENSGAIICKFILESKFVAAYLGLPPVKLNFLFCLIESLLHINQQFALCTRVLSVFLRERCTCCGSRLRTPCRRASRPLLSRRSLSPATSAPATDTASAPSDISGTTVRVHKCRDYFEDLEALAFC